MSTGLEATDNGIAVRRQRPLAALRVILAIVIGAFPLAATAKDRLSTREMEALSARAANATIRDDLLSVLQPVGRIRSGMLIRLRGVGLTTRAFGTDFDGLCRRDAVSLLYAPSDLGPKPADQPLEPYSIEAQPLFHISRLPTAEKGDGRTSVWTAECDRLSHDEGAAWFSAKTALVAAQGANWLRMAIDQVKAGTLKARPCQSLIKAGLSCEQAIIDNSDMATIDAIETCTAEPGFACFAIDLGSTTKLTIIGQGDPDALVPTMIQSIAIEQYVIVT
jgi:hypothetical protein